jgi:hypothetical protein
MKNAFYAFIASIVTLIAASSANALPFNPNPSSFENWLNAKNIPWENGAQKIKFSYLGGCLETNVGHYFCTQGYARISDPLGTRTCQLLNVTYQPTPKDLSVYPPEMRRFMQWGQQIGAVQDLTYQCRNPNPVVVQPQNPQWRPKTGFTRNPQ